MSILRTLGLVGGTFALSKLFDNIRDIDSDSLLHRAGLQRAPSTAHSAMSTIGLLAGGALVGGIVAWFVAPSSGKQLRSKIAESARTTRKSVANSVDEARDAVSAKVTSAKEKVAASLVGEP